MATRRAGRLIGARSGASTAEFALVFPVFIVFMLGVFEFARAFWAANTLQYAVSQGARYAGLPRVASLCNPTPNLDAYQTSLQTYLQAQLAPVLPSATVTAPAGTCGPDSPSTTVTVTLTVSYNFNFILISDLVPVGPIALQQQAIAVTPLTAPPS